MRGNTDQNNSEYGHFLRSAKVVTTLWPILPKTVMKYFKQKTSFLQNLLKLLYKVSAMLTFLYGDFFNTFIRLLEALRKCSKPTKPLKSLKTFKYYIKVAPHELFFSSLLIICLIYFMELQIITLGFEIFAIFQLGSKIQTKNTNLGGTK